MKGRVMALSLRCLQRLELLASIALVLPGVAASGEPSLDASHYVWRATRGAGAVVLRDAFGGEYVYSQTEPSDGRVEQRFSIGKAPRTEFELFSADEEAALWLLRDRQTHPEAYLPLRPHRRVFAPVAASRPSVDWPKVIVGDGKTCVPEAAFSNVPDWKSHLICWLDATREITHD